MLEPLPVPSEPGGLRGDRGEPHRPAAIDGGDLLGGGRKGGSSLPWRATLGLDQTADLSCVGSELGIAGERGRKPDQGNGAVAVACAPGRLRSGH
jgi:hypothetical protein